MRPISAKVKRLLDEEPDVCALKEYHTCDGRITREHTLIYAGKQIDEAWAIIKLCAKYHGVDQFQDNGLLNKEMNVWVALSKANDADLIRYSKVVDYIRLKKTLNAKYGIYKFPYPRKN